MAENRDGVNQRETEPKRNRSKFPRNFDKSNLYTWIFEANWKINESRIF